MKFRYDTLIVYLSPSFSQDSHNGIGSFTVGARRALANVALQHMLDSHGSAAQLATLFS